MHAPDRPVPDPRAVTGTPCSVGQAHDRGDLVGVGRPHDGERALRRGGERLVVGVVVADGVAGEHVAGADDVLEVEQSAMATVSRSTAVLRSARSGRAAP